MVDSTTSVSAERRQHLLDVAQEGRRSGRRPAPHAGRAARGGCRAGTRPGAARRRSCRCRGHPGPPGHRAGPERMIASCSAWIVETISDMRPVRSADKRREQCGLADQAFAIIGRPTPPGRGCRRRGRRRSVRRAGDGVAGKPRPDPPLSPGRRVAPPARASRSATDRDRHRKARSGRCRTSPRPTVSIRPKHSPRSTVIS